MNPPPYAELLAAREILLLVREKGRIFTAPGVFPRWFRLFVPGDLTPASKIEPGGIFPFLDHFLEDAENFWTSEKSGELRSGVWSEDSPESGQLHFEAFAYKFGHADYLVVRRLVSGFNQLHRLVQKGREISLMHEKLVHEISKKDILLHCIIHDIAGPLQSMIGALQIADQKEQPANVRRLLKLGLVAAKQQGNLISDLLDTFRAENASVEALAADPATAPDLVCCARTVMETLQPAFTARGVAGEFLAPADGAPLRVVAELSRLERVFYNLLQNAMRHSPTRGVVTISLRDEEEFVRIAVEDEGDGVPPEIVPQLFQKFVRHGQARGKTGLGLFFCRISVEQWGGTIGCEPRTGGGTTFWFRLKKCAPVATANVPLETATFRSH